MPDTDNIGVEILVLSSVALISNIGLLTAESLTGEPNYKDPTSNEEYFPDDYEVGDILIGDLCVQPTYTPRKVILKKTGIMGDLVKLVVIVHHPQWNHHPLINIQVVLWVVLRFIFVLVMVKLLWDLDPPTLPPIKFILGLMVAIFCDLRVGNIHP